MLDPRISALEEDLDEVESSEEEDEEEEKVQMSEESWTSRLEGGEMTMFGVFLHSQSGFRPLSRTDAVTVTTTDLGGPRRRATDAVVRPDGLCFSHICSELLSHVKTNLDLLPLQAEPVATETQVFRHLGLLIPPLESGFVSDWLVCVVLSPSPRRDRHRSKSPRRHRSRSRDRRHRSKSPGTRRLLARAPVHMIPRCARRADAAGA